MDILQQQTSQMLQIIIGGLFSALLALGVMYLKKGFTFLKLKSNSIEDADARTIIQKALNDLDNVLVTNITSADSTLKPIILKDISDGKVTKDELNSLADTVMNNTLNQLGNDSLDVLNGALGDTNGYIENRIEKILADLKVDNTSSVTKTIISEIPQEVKDNTELTNKLNQVQAEKDELMTQVNMIVNEKSNVEQTNQQLANQINELNNQKQQLEADKQALQSKLDSITQVVQPTNNISIDKVTVNSNDAQELLNGIVDIANQTTTL